MARGAGLSGETVGAAVSLAGSAAAAVKGKNVQPRSKATHEYAGEPIAPRMPSLLNSRTILAAR